MRILVAGSSGLIGTEFVKRRVAAGDEVMRLERRSPVAANEIEWHPDLDFMDAHKVEGFDVVVNFCGENIVSARWTESKKKRIRESRLQPTRFLASLLGKLKRPPGLWMNASAVGYYGNRGGDLLDEGAAKGSGFLADLCAEWEAAASLPEGSKTRVVHLRTGIVLSSKGGALKKLVPLFRCCLGGKIGSGQQYMSWIAIDDYLDALDHIIKHGEMAGAVNLVAPNAVTNLAFTETLGKVLHRPTFASVPASVARFTLGEMADEMLLTSERVVPQKLTQGGFSFKYPYLEEALRSVLN